MNAFIYLAKVLISFYQIFISPFLGTNCRFYPSCSVYAKDAIERHGIIKGGFFTIKRLLRCNPFFAGGEDLVPKKQKLK